MIYQKHGNIWAMEFTFKGRRYQRSCHTESKRIAEEIERAFRTNLAKGLVGIEEKPEARRRTVGELLDALEQDYAIRGKASKANLSLISVVRGSFGDRMADALKDDDITAYVARLRRQKTSDKTLKNHLQVLKQAFTDAKLVPPCAPELENGNVRTGFLIRAEFDSLYSQLPEDLKDFALFAYLTGWRKGAITKLEWSDVRDGNIYLRAKHSKNGQPYFVPLAGELSDLVERRKQARAITTATGTVLSRLVFHREGIAVADFDKSWATACKHSGCEGTLFHDLRRSAARNLIRAGVHRAVAKNIIGHKTDSMFERYNITSEADLTDAVAKLNTYSLTQRQKVVSIASR